MDKEYILNNVAELTPQQLAEAIQASIVTLQELRDTDELDASKRKAITKITSKVEREIEQAWQNASSGNVTQLQEFIAKYPSSPKAAEAQNLINLKQTQEIKQAWLNAKNGDENQLQEFINKYPTCDYAATAQIFLENKKYEKLNELKKIIDNIKLNPNTYSPPEIQKYLSNGKISKDDLIYKCGIPNSAIDNLQNITPVMLNIGKTPNYIPEGYTEVYFWGGPGSGKTCALGAVLQMADYRGCLTIAPGAGYNYASQLKNIFSHDNQANDYLPAPSPVETTQYLPFSLQLPNEKKSRSVSLIELSGEIFECFYWKNGGLQLPTANHENTFNSLNNFLSSKNRKLHFFFIDAGRDNKRDNRGLTQSDYLQATATYFKGNQLFDKTTDAIYVVLTKSDLLVDEYGNIVPDDKRTEYAKKHLTDQKNGYNSFINVLKSICSKYSINGGKLTVEPFSLGKVYFQQICNFDGTSANRILDILLERVPGTRKSILEFFNA